MAGNYGIQHKRDGRWYAGFTADRARRLIWSSDARQAWSGTREEVEAQACLLARYYKSVSPSPFPITA